MKFPTTTSPEIASPGGLNKYHRRLSTSTTLQETHLVEIRLQEMHLLLRLEQPGPILFLGLLFPQYELDITGAMYRLGVFDVDFSKKLKLDVVGGFLGVGFAGKGQARRLQVDFAGFGRYVGRGDGEIDDVFLGDRDVGALGPED